MTLLVAWATALAKVPNSVYLASDSRITWDRRKGRWDAGRKLFACRTSPDIFGFSGDVLFASQVLGQIIDLVDNGVLFNAASRAQRRHDAAVAALKASHLRRHDTPEADFEIVHIARSGSRMDTHFIGWATRFCANRRSWSDDEFELSPLKPAAFGSGAQHFHQRIEMRPTPPQDELERVPFLAFRECLASGSDPASGGVPQLSGVYRIGVGRPIGFVDGRDRFLYGLPVDAVHSGNLEWRDQAFRAIHGPTLRQKRLVRRADRARSPGVPWR